MSRRPSRRSGGRPTRARSRVVLDTGVLVSAFAFGGVPAKAVRKACLEADLFVSPDLLKEYREVPGELAASGKITPAQYKALIAGIASVVASACVVRPRKRLKICRDPSDDMVVNCCLAAGADTLVSGDRDLLEIPRTAVRFLIVTPAVFLKG